MSGAAVIKMWLIEPYEFQRGLQGENYFHNNTKALSILFYHVDICTDIVNATVDKNAGVLAQIMRVTRNHNTSHCSLHYNTFAGNRWDGGSQFYSTILDQFF